MQELTLGDGVDLEGVGQGGFLIHVHLGEADALHLPRQLLHDGAQHAAGAAPAGPEIHHRDAGGGLICKSCGGQFYRFHICILLCG